MSHTHTHSHPERFLSNSGRTAGTISRQGLQTLAEEHEWLRDRVARLELENALLRSVMEATGTMPCRPTVRI